MTDNATTDSHRDAADSHRDATDAPAKVLFTEQPAFQVLGVLAMLAIFCVLAVPLMNGDLWFDELITVFDYGVRPSPRTLFTQYPVANNHILFSFVLWIWIHFLTVFFQDPVPVQQIVYMISEQALRLPCLLMALVTLVILHRQCRKLFDNTAAFLVVLLMVLSPIYLGFHYQLRGYGLSILLSVAATIGALHIVRGHWRTGLFYYIPAVLLLPGVIPSNLLVNFSLFIFINLAMLRQGQWRSVVPLLALVGLCSVAGVLIYLPVLEQFMDVARRTGGWDSGGQVALHWLLALFAHGGLFVLACLAFRRWWRSADAAPDASKSKGCQSTVAVLPLLLVCCLVPIIVVALLRAPYPRAFLAYLGPLTFCALIAYRPGMCRTNRHVTMLVLVISANALIWQRVATQSRDSDIAGGKYPQNLLQQYYAGGQYTSRTAMAMAYSPAVVPRTRMFVDFNHYVSFRYYWARLGRRNYQIECMRGESLFPLKLERQEDYARVPQLLVGHTMEQVKEAYLMTIGVKVELEVLVPPGPFNLGVFRVINRTPPPFGHREMAGADGSPAKQPENG